MRFHIAALLGASLLGVAFGQAPATSGVVQAGAGNPYQRAGQLAPRIMEFTAQPASVTAGQSVNLAWATENPQNPTIEPGLGKVTARGSRQVTPTATTTYTLTVNGPNNVVLTKTVTVTVNGSAASAPAAASAKLEVPRRPDGKPDFSGVYGAALGGGGRGGAPAAAVPAGGIPTTPTLKAGAEKFKVVRPANDQGQYADCMPVAPPQAFSVPYQFQFVQSADHLIILHEYPGTFRIIPLTGVAHPADPDPTWLGDSVAKWEGDTLVIDTVGFNDKTEINGYRHTDALHLVERLRRPSFDVVEYEAVIEDPNVFAGPWRVARKFGLRTDLNKIDEFVCEHNQDYGKFFEKK